MPRYSDELLNEIFAQNDMVDYVSQYVRLKKNGRDYTGLCPFHKEKSPSFHVNQDKQLFHCFGCGAGGNLVQFVMRAEGLDFVEAVKLMADRAGIILPEDDFQPDDKLYKKKKRILEMNKTAAQIYYKTLTKEPEGKPGLDYFAERRITRGTIVRYGLGYAPDGFDFLKKRLNKLGYYDDELIEAGLCVARGNNVYDKFRSRVIFPIIDLRGNVIAFGGRIINSADKEKDGYKPPKYLNSSETPVFSKGKNLFSLNLAKKSSDTQCILCEGYMDVISVNQAGIANIVATLGTALTENQAKLLMKYTNEILLCYDSDEAGQAATRRAIDIITGVGGKCRVMRLKGAKDPDEYIKANGVESFKRVMHDAAASTEFLLKSLKSKYDLDNPDGKIMFLQDSAAVLAKIPNEIEVDAYVRKLSDETEISRDAIYAEIKKLAGQNKIAQGTPRVIRTQTNAGEKKDIKSNDAESRLLSLIISSKKCYQAVKDEFSPEDFSSEVLCKLAHIIYDLYEKGEPIEEALIVNKFGADENAVREVMKVFYNIEVYGSEHNTIVQLVANIKISRIEQEIEKAKAENDAAKIKELLDLRLKLEGKKKCQN